MTAKANPASKTKKPATVKKPTATLKRFHITAVIPTVQYGNMQPEYEVEAESYEAAEASAMPYIERLWAKYCAKGSELKINKVTEVKKEVGLSVVAPEVSTTKLVSTTTPGVAYFESIDHKYMDDKGKFFLGGSTFAHQYQKDFEKDKILEMMKEKFEVDTEEVSALWAIKGEASSHLGTAIHAALEMYGKYHKLGKILGANKKPVVNTALHDNPILKSIVEKFFKGREEEDCLYEEFVGDNDKMWCGQIDRLKILNRQDKVCRVQDYKTNFDVNKKGFNGTLLQPFDNLPDTPLSGYWLQLSFYAHILKLHGWTVEGLDVLHFNGEDWIVYTREPIDLTDVLNKEEA